MSRIFSDQEERLLLQLFSHGCAARDFKDPCARSTRYYLLRQLFHAGYIRSVLTLPAHQPPYQRFTLTKTGRKRLLQHLFNQGYLLAQYQAIPNAVHLFNNRP